MGADIIMNKDIFVGKCMLQPKKEIMSYLASKGVKVPRIYDSIEDAAKDLGKKDIFLRSEHPQDYEGSSDLFPNENLEAKLLDSGDVTRAILSQDNNYVTNSIERISLHCKLLGLDYEAFIKNLSHSAWEFVGGANRTIFADSAIPKRYHIIALADGEYSIVENSTVTFLTEGKHGNLGQKEAMSLIELYEQIKSIMDPNHCYIIETETVLDFSSKIREYFAVQVHRGVDFKKSEFTLDPEKSGRIKFHMVRGATGPEGEDLLLTVKYPREFSDDPRIIPESASMQLSEHYVPRAFSEIMFRQRRLQIFPFQGSYDLRRELDSHCSRNALFKPYVSALAYGPSLYDAIDEGILRSKDLIQRNIHFVSDGRRGYMDFMD